VSLARGEGRGARGEGVSVDRGDERTGWEGYMAKSWMMASVLPVRRAKDILKHDLDLSSLVGSASHPAIILNGYSRSLSGTIPCGERRTVVLQNTPWLANSWEVPSYIFCQPIRPRSVVRSMHASYPRHEHPLAGKGIESVDNLIVAHPKTWACTAIESSRHLNRTHSRLF